MSPTTQPSCHEDSDRPHELISSPYEIGTPIKLEQDGKIINATIKQVYSAGSMGQFSNSCTVLINITGAIGSEIEETGAPGREMVVKIMDWRYMDTPRSDWQCGVWTVERSNALSAFSMEDAVALQNWLCYEMSEDDCNHPFVRRLVEQGILYELPTRMDLYGYVMRRPRAEAERYLQERLIPQIPDITEQEVFLQVLVNTQLTIEARTAVSVQTSMPGWMPWSHGVVNVEIASQTPLPKPLQLQGLLMDKAHGTPIALLPPGELSHKVVLDIAEDVVLFQLELRRHDLDIRDTNLHNILLTHDDNGNGHIMVVDFGAIYFIAPEYHNTALIHIKLPLNSNVIRISQDYCTSFFDVEIEPDLVYGLAAYLSTPSSETYPDVNSVLSHWNNPDLLTPEDNFIWYIIMLQIIYSIDVQLFRTHGTSVLELIRRVSQIMREEYSTSSAYDVWGLQACGRIALFTGSDEAHARQIMSFVTDMLGSGLDEYDGALPLILARDLVGQHQLPIPGSFLTHINEKIKSMRTSKVNTDHERQALRPTSPAS